MLSYAILVWLSVMEVQGFVDEGGDESFEVGFLHG
jgi:flavin-binding protein dodecin